MVPLSVCKTTTGRCSWACILNTPSNSIVSNNSLLIFRKYKYLNLQYTSPSRISSLVIFFLSSEYQQ